LKSYLLIVGCALPVVALGVTAAMAGEDGDAPGLSLIGIVLIVAALAVAVRVAQRTAR
jgi:hypothetical protein